MHRTRNAAYGQPYRGFESLPLRHPSPLRGFRFGYRTAALSLRGGRAGLAVDNVMTYVTAGLDYAKTNHSSNDAGLVNHEIGTTKVGFVAGFGAEYGLDPR